MKTLFITKDYLIDPLGIAYLSSYLKASGHEVDILKINGQSTFSEIKASKADMLCYSVTTGNHVFYQQFNADYREYSRNGEVSVFGGAHPTFFPEFALAEGVDIAVRGEGFDAIVDIADALQDDKLVDGIPNVVCGESVNPLRPVMPKDSLLLPDRDLIYTYQKNYHNPIKNVMCSHQCPFSCSYCYAAQYKEMYGLKTAEIRPVPSVMEEIEDLRRFPLKMIFMQDDLFPLYDKPWLVQFCEEYSNVGIPFHIQIRAEYVDDDSIRQLKEVGLHGATFAIESGDSELRRNVLNKKLSDDAIYDAVDVLHKHGVKLRIENMIGFPGETWESAMKTLDMNIKCTPTIAWASLYQPYPGTVLGDQCLEDGLFNGDYSKITTSFFDKYLLDVPHGMRLERLQKLFSLLVAWPRLRWFSRLLCMLPLGAIYKKVFSWHKKRLYTRLYSTGDK